MWRNKKKNFDTTNLPRVSNIFLRIYVFDLVNNNIKKLRWHFFFILFNPTPEMTLTLWVLLFCSVLFFLFFSFLYISIKMKQIKIKMLWQICFSCVLLFFYFFLFFSPNFFPPFFIYSYPHNLYNGLPSIQNIQIINSISI